MAYGRKRYQRPISPGFQPGVKVDYLGAYSMHRPSYQELTIDRVLGTGHAIVKQPIFTPPGERQRFKEVKFQITGQDYADEVGEGRYKATIYLLTSAHLERKANDLTYRNDQARRKAIGMAMKELPIFGLTEEQMCACEAIINSLKKPE